MENIREINLKNKAVDYIRKHSKEALAVILKYEDFKPKKAGRMGLYHFDKAGETPDFAALEKVRNKDLRPFHFTASETGTCMPKPEKHPFAADLPAFAVHLKKLIS